MRNASKTLREGTFVTWEVGADGLYAYLRRTDEETPALRAEYVRRISRNDGSPETLAGQKTLCDRLTGKRLAVRGET